MNEEQNEVKQVIVQLQVQSFVPVMTQKQFGDLSGQTYEAVKAQVSNGHLPSLKVGKRRMVNLVALVDMAKASFVGGV